MTDVAQACDTVVVVPCFNEAGRLPRDEFASCLESDRRTSFVFVDDGSRDGTAGVLTSLAEDAPERVQALILDENLGKAEAVRTGLRSALEQQPRFVGYWDADLSTPLAAIATLRGVLDADPEIEWVLGSRVQLLGRDIERRVLRHYAGRVFATLASLALGLPVYDTQCGAKLFRASRELESLLAEPFLTTWEFDVELIARLVRARRGSERPQAHEVIYEYPLERWHDVPGSKVRALDFFGSILGLARIRRTYLQ